jgi:hypothetical protein
VSECFRPRGIIFSRFSPFFRWFWPRPADFGATQPKFRHSRAGFRFGRRKCGEKSALCSARTPYVIHIIRGPLVPTRWHLPDPPLFIRGPPAPGVSKCSPCSGPPPAAGKLRPPKPFFGPGSCERPKNTHTEARVVLMTQYGPLHTLQPANTTHMDWTEVKGDVFCFPSVLLGPNWTKMVAKVVLPGAQKGTRKENNRRF